MCSAPFMKGEILVSTLEASERCTYTGCTLSCLQYGLMDIVSWVDFNKYEVET